MTRTEAHEIRDYAAELADTESATVRANRDNGEHVPTDLRLDAGIHEELEGLPA